MYLVYFDQIHLIYVTLLDYQIDVLKVNKKRGYFSPPQASH
jgi:hypothetical protein